MGQFLKDYGQLISITLIPFIIWFVGIKFQNRSSKQKAKLDLFLQIMANRKKYPPSSEMALGLNQIDIIFQDSSKVRAAWRSYFDALHPNSQHNSTSNSFLLDLLSEMANNLGYQNLKQTELDRYYQPQSSINLIESQELLYSYQLEVLKEQYRVLQHSKNSGDGFSDEEYQRYLTELEEKKKGKA